MPVYHTFHSSDLTESMTTLADQVQRFFPHKFDTVVGIARGGLVPAVYIANQLEVAKVESVGVRSYSGHDQGSLEFYQDIPDVMGQTVLLVDDLCDTGDTMRAVHDKLAETVHRVFTATIFYKPKSTYRPDAYWKEVKDDHWVVFPWEKQE